MKLAHLGDLHLGKIVNEFNMVDDQRYILDQITFLCEKENIDAILLAGDIYDKSIPTEEAVALFDYFLSELTKRKIKTFIISGNHDSDERLNFGRKLFANSDIYISSKYDGKLFKQSIEDEFGVVNFYLMPFVKASQVKKFFPSEKIDSYHDAVKVVIDHAQLDKSQRNVILAHQFVGSRNRDFPDCSGSESFELRKAMMESVGTIELIGVDAFDNFDYVALGHVHSPQKLERESVRYSGSPLKYSLSEVNNKKSMPVVTLGAKGQLSVELVDLKPRRDLRHIKGELKQLLKKENIISPDDYMYVTLTDEVPEIDAVNIVRDFYPNLMKLDYDNSHTRGAGQSDIQTMTETKSFKEILSDFYLLRYGKEMEKEELQIMLEAAREAGIEV